MVKYVPMIDDINPLAALNLYFPGTFDMWAILGANSRQTKLPGCGCYQRAPAWHGIRDVFPGPESATTPYRERSGPRKDHSQWQGHTGSPVDAQGVSEPKSLWLDETRSTSEFHPKTTTVHQKKPTIHPKTTSIHPKTTTIHWHPKTSTDESVLLQHLLPSQAHGGHQIWSRTVAKWHPLRSRDLVGKMWRGAGAVSIGRISSSFRKSRSW